MNTEFYISQTPSQGEIFQMVVTIVSNLWDLDPKDIKMESLLQDDLGADGLDIVELIMTLENEFGIVLPDDIFLPNLNEAEIDEVEENEQDEYPDPEEDYLENEVEDDEYENEEMVEYDNEEEETDGFDTDSVPYTLTIADYVEYIHKSLQ